MPEEAAAPPTSVPLLASSYHPTTFADRGAAVAFTTPALLGTRVRLAAARPSGRDGVEFIVFNPAGGRGVYALPWAGVCDLCRPTVHDTMLARRLGALSTITPDSVRRAARAVAVAGMAGRDAVAAAVAAAESDRRDELAAREHLLKALSARTGAEEFAPDALDPIARVFAGIGVSGQEPPARITRLLAAIETLRADMAAWAGAHVGETEAEAGMIAAVAAMTVACAECALGETHAMIGDMAGLLRGWVRNQAGLAGRIARPEWLVDGWETICLIWHCADGEAARREAVREMAALAPILPRETAEWVGSRIDTDAAGRFRKAVARDQDWRAGSAPDRIVRNEALRSLDV